MDLENKNAVLNACDMSEIIQVQKVVTQFNETLPLLARSAKFTCSMSLSKKVLASRLDSSLTTVSKCDNHSNLEMGIALIGMES